MGLASFNRARLARLRDEEKKRQRLEKEIRKALEAQTLRLSKILQAKRAANEGIQVQEVEAPAKVETLEEKVDGSAPKKTPLRRRKKAPAGE